MGAEDYTDLADWDDDLDSAHEGHDADAPRWDTVEWPVKAILVNNEASWQVLLWWPQGTRLWLPKSQCQLSEDREWVTIPGWLAKAKGLPATNTEYPD